MNRRVGPRAWPVFLTGGVCLWGAASWAADPFDRSGAFVRGDFDDDGLVDIVASSPETDCGKGSVYVLSGSGGSAAWTRDTSGVLGTAACDDHFGASLGVGDFDADGYDDLAIGAPGASDPGPSASGVVHILYGSSAGLTETGDQMWHQDVSGIDDDAEASDYYGDALAVGDFNCDGHDDLAIGAPRENISTTVDAGAVSVLYGRAGGLSTVNDLWYQGAGGVDETPNSGDHFGASLATGNFNGDDNSGIACSDLAIGAPDEDAGTAILDAGYLYLIFGDSTFGLSTTSDQSFDQDTSGVEDSCESSDQFAFRLQSLDLDANGYDDLWVTVPGDGCTGSAGWGRHTFYGSSSGLATTDDMVDCDLFGCLVEGTGFTCPSSRTVHASSSADRLWLMFEDDAAWGWGGNDHILGSVGNDALFGGAGNDTLEGAIGADLLVGGVGDDSFRLDQDCEIDADDVIDGGPGTDTVYSHKTQSELATAGVTLVSVENFVTVSQANVSAWGDCGPFPYHFGPNRPTALMLSWQELPSDSSLVTSTTGLLHLDVVNQINSSRTFNVHYTLTVGGVVLALEETATTLTALDDTSFTLDLSDFIPTGIDPQTVDPDLLVTSASASLTASADVVVGGQVVETAFAPTLYGHAHDSQTLKIYRRGAMNSNYCGGDLASCRAGVTNASAYSGRGEAWGIAQ